MKKGRKSRGPLPSIKATKVIFPPLYVYLGCFQIPFKYSGIGNNLWSNYSICNCKCKKVKKTTGYKTRTRQSFTFNLS